MFDIPAEVIALLNTAISLALLAVALVAILDLRNRREASLEFSVEREGMGEGMARRKHLEGSDGWEHVIGFVSLVKNPSSRNNAIVSAVAIAARGAQEETVALATAGTEEGFDLGRPLDSKTELPLNIPAGATERVDLMFVTQEPMTEQERRRSAPESCRVEFTDTYGRSRSVELWNRTEKPARPV